MMHFEWVEPATVAEALQALSNYGDEAKLVAGGTWITLVLKQGLLYPAALISLNRIPGLDTIQYDETKGLNVGAMVTHRTLELDTRIQQHYPMLAETFGAVANVRIRNQATAGGCICDADYASDPPAILIALDASVRVQSANEERRIAVEDFIIGHYETTIQPDEMLTEISIPKLPTGGRGIYLKYRTRSHEDRPCVGVAVVLATEEATVSHLRVVVGAVAARPQRIVDAENLALGKVMTESIARQIGEAYAEGIDPLDDLRGSAWYRRQMIRVLVRRAILQAVQREPVP